MVCGSCRTFLIAPLRWYQYSFCGCPTGGFRQNRGMWAINDRPYGARCKIQHRTNVARGSYGFLRTLDTGIPEIYVSVGASNRL